MPLPERLSMISEICKADECQVLLSCTFCTYALPLDFYGWFEIIKVAQLNHRIHAASSISPSSPVRSEPIQFYSQAGSHHLNILFVCLGNICRSPMAEGIMRMLYEQRSIEGLIDSAGTADWNAGIPASPHSVAVAAEHGIDIRSHRARQVRLDDFSDFDRIYVMDHENLKDMLSFAPASFHEKIRLLRGNLDVRDPYAGTLRDYREAYKVIEEACITIAEQLPCHRRAT